MLERPETFRGEQMRRQDERRYAEAYRLSQQGLEFRSGGQVLRSLMISMGKRLIKMGERTQGPLESGTNSITARVP